MILAHSHATDRPTAPRYAWIVLAVVYLAGVAGPLNQFKVPPVMPVLIEALHLQVSNAGWLMSVFSIIGFILAIPAGFILQRFGPKATGLLAIGFMIVGSITGALSSTAESLLLSRFIEGVGMGLISVVGPAAIAMWFPAAARGLPMGIWATWVPAGSIVMFNLAPSLTQSMGWQAVWWASAAFNAVAFVLYALFFRLPTMTEVRGPAGDSEQVPDTRGIRGAMRNSSIWLVSVSFMCFNWAIVAFASFYPTFLTSVRNLSLEQAGFIASLPMMASMFSSPLGGWLSDRIGSRKKIIALPMAGLALFFLFPFHVSGWLIVALMITLGMTLGPIPTATFAAVPEIMARPEWIGMGMGIIALGQNLGMVAGPALFGRMAASFGWATAGYALIPICAAGVIAGLLARVR